MILYPIIPQADGRGGRSPFQNILLKIYFNDTLSNNSAGRWPRRAKPISKYIVKNIF